MSQQVTDIMNDRFPVILEVPPYNKSSSRFADRGGAEPPIISASIRKSIKTGLHLVICQVPSETVYGNFMFLTKASSDKPLAAIVQRLTGCGSHHFQEDFVSKLGREIHAYTGTILHADRSVFTINTESSRGLIAMLPPYLDALFRPLMTVESYCKHVHTPASLVPKYGRHKGNMYRDLLELSKEKNRRLNIDELVYPRNVPYSFNCEGTAESLSRVEIEESRAYHGHYYRPSNCFIILAGRIDEASVMTVLKAFEDDLSPECIKDCQDLPAKLACPSSSPRLEHPDVLSLFPKDALESSITDADRRHSMALSPGLRVRFVSEIIERSAKEKQKENPCPREVHMHLVSQGPDIFDHTEFAAFLLFGTHIKDLLRRGPWDGVSLEVKERKWPLLIFTVHHLALTEVETAHQQFKDIVQDCMTQTDTALKSLVSTLIANAIMETNEQLKWRADYDTVKSIAWWLSACSLNTPGAAQSFSKAVHPAQDYDEMAQKSIKWWRGVIDRGFRQCVMILEPAKGGPVSLETVTKPLGTSSRYSMSSLTSERAFPLPEDFDETDLRTLKLKAFSPLRGPKEIDWCKDQGVRQYCQDIGCYDIREFYSGTQSRLNG